MRGLCGDLLGASPSDPAHRVRNWQTSAGEAVADGIGVDWRWVLPEQRFQTSC